MVQGLCAKTISVEDASSSSSQRLNIFAQELVLDLAQALGTCPMYISTAGDVDKSGHDGLQGCERASIQSFRVAGQSTGRIILFLKDKRCEVLIAIWPARPHSPSDLARER